MSTIKLSSSIKIQCKIDEIVSRWRYCRRANNQLSNCLRVKECKCSKPALPSQSRFEHTFLTLNYWRGRENNFLGMLSIKGNASERRSKNSPKLMDL